MTAERFSGSNTSLPSPLRGGAGGGGARTGLSETTPPLPTLSPQGGEGLGGRGRITARRTGRSRCSARRSSG
ncbi:MAG: hypothetical protein GC203_07075 [Phenylobacterium sp.]|nr:hypothetical protein [Phenylobacterium sp.]